MNNGGEYDSQEFKEFYAEKRIIMIRTVPGRLEHNGIAERMNNTRSPRSIRLHVGLRKIFWADAINTVAYLINRGPLILLGFKILEEELIDNGANLS